MKQIALLSFAFLFVSCFSIDEESTDDFLCNSNNPHYFSPEFKTFISPAKSEAIYLFCSQNHFIEIDDFTNLNANKICLLEENFRKVHSLNKNSDHCQSFYELLVLEKYYYQFLGFTSKGEEYILISAFTFPPGDTTEKYQNWKTDLIINCRQIESRWTAIFNLNTLEFDELDDDYTQWVVIEYDSGIRLNTNCNFCSTIGINGYFEPGPDQIEKLLHNFHKLDTLTSTICNVVGQRINTCKKYQHQFYGVIADLNSYIYVNGIPKSWFDLDDRIRFWQTNLRNPCFF